MTEEILTIPKVEEITIRDYGIIQNANIEFTDGLNIITGKGATGKSAVVQFLRKKFNPELLSIGENIMLQVDNVLGDQTILMDDILARLTKENLIKTLEKLSESKRQVILCLNDYYLPEIKKEIKDVNIINTKNFELKEENQND